jgi:thioredoxin 1
MATKTVTDQSFATDVLGAEGPVLVDFWAEWCGPCRMIAPALEEISQELGDKVTVAKLNIDENPDVPGRYGVRGIPTMLLFKGGQPVAQKVGAAPRSQIQQWLDRARACQGGTSRASAAHRPGRTRRPCFPRRCERRGGSPPARPK